MTNQNEKWRIIIEFPNYIVSDKGNVMSLPKISKVIKGHTINNKQRAGKLLKPRKVPSGGHLQVHLKQDGKSKWVYVHRLVAETWLKRMKNNNVVMHLDDNPENNCVENLQWGTQLQNVQWIYKQSEFIKLGNNIDERAIKVYNMINDIRTKTNYSVNKCFDIVGKKYNRAYSTMMQYYYKGKQLSIPT